LERKLHSDLPSKMRRIADNSGCGEVIEAAQWQSITSQLPLEMEHPPPSELWPISHRDSDALACCLDRCSPSCETTLSAATSGVCAPCPRCTKRRYLSRRYCHPFHSSEYRFPLCSSFASNMQPTCPTVAAAIEVSTAREALQGFDNPT